MIVSTEFSACNRIDTNEKCDMCMKENWKRIIERKVIESVMEEKRRLSYL